MKTDISELIMATRKDKHGPAGSLYFPQGRIRLEDKGGPKVESYASLYRFMVPSYKKLDACGACHPFLGSDGKRVDCLIECLDILADICVEIPEERSEAQETVREFRCAGRNATCLIEIADGNLRDRGYLFLTDGLTQEDIDELRDNIAKGKADGLTDEARNDYLRGFITTNGGLAKKLGYS